MGSGIAERRRLTLMVAMVAVLSCACVVAETFGQIETIMQEIMRGLQERHAVSHAHFEATESKLSRSLREHNRVRAAFVYSFDG